MTLKDPRTGKHFPIDTEETDPLYRKQADQVISWLTKYFDHGEPFRIDSEQSPGVGYYVFGKRNPFKHLKAEGPGETDFTVYLGSKDDTDAFIQAMKSDKN